MPTSFSINCNLCPKKYKLTFLFLLTPLLFFGQTLTGLWTGALSNDSTTIRKDQLFEIALTEYKGKVYGYSRSEFIVNDTLYYIVKRVKGTIEGDICEVTDDDIISYNFRGKLDKGVKVTSTFRRNNSDSSWYLAGTWKTNATKKYYAVTGKVDLESEKDLTASKIFPHLEELKLADEVAFYKERKEAIPIVKIAKPEKIKTEYSFKTDQLSTTPEITLIANQPVIQTKTGPAESVPQPGETTTDLVKEEQQESLPAIKKPENNLPKTELKDISQTPVTITPSPTTKMVVVNKPGSVSASPVKTIPVATGTEIKNPETTVAKTTAPQRTNPASEKKETVSAPLVKNVPKQDNTVGSVKSAPAVPGNEKKNPEADPVIEKIAAPVKTNVNTAIISKPSAPEIKKPLEEIIQKAASIAGRKSEFSQIVNFVSDSLELALYDNGEIDGDTVSVFMNGEVIVSKQGLKASAFKKIIYIRPGQDEDFTLVMFAENLGKYPPNTGLLVVHDGEEIYHLRFSSDFDKSTGIVFHKKK